MAVFPRFVRLLACALLLGCAPDAFAQVHKCVMPDGKPLYTDQACAALGASERPPEPTPGGVKAPGAAGAGFYRSGCSRTLQDLVFEIRTAIDAGDANRLSSLYHWVGASDASANAVMDRLDAIVQRPLLDITPISDSVAADTTVLAMPDDVPRTTARRPPVGLRLAQTTGNGITPSSTNLGLRRHFGCWWISL